MMDITNARPSAKLPTPTRGQLPVARLEWGVLLAALCLLAVALFGPSVSQPDAYHRFADQRALGDVPFASDVLSNLGFVVGGAWGLWRLGQAGREGRQGLAGPVWVSAVLFFGGLVATGIGSGLYHWQPDAVGLMLDRTAMGLAFAGLLGLAVADRVSGRAALCVVLGVLVLAPVAAALAWRGDNAAPWLVLQVGGLVVMLALATVTPRGRCDGGAWGLPLFTVVMVYALAKVLELADHAVFDFAHGWVSGHTLKHVVAACVAWPIGRGLGFRDPDISESSAHGEPAQGVAQPVARGKMHAVPECPRVPPGSRPGSPPDLPARLAPSAHLFDSPLTHSAQARQP